MVECECCHSDRVIADTVFLDETVLSVTLFCKNCNYEWDVEASRIENMTVRQVMDEIDDNAAVSEYLQECGYVVVER